MDEGLTAAQVILAHCSTCERAPRVTEGAVEKLVPESCAVALAGRGGAPGDLEVVSGPTGLPSSPRTVSALHGEMQDFVDEAVALEPRGGVVLELMCTEGGADKAQGAPHPRGRDAGAMDESRGKRRCTTDNTPKTEPRPHQTPGGCVIDLGGTIVSDTAAEPSTLHPNSAARGAEEKEQCPAGTPETESQQPAAGGTAAAASNQCLQGEPVCVPSPRLLTPYLLCRMVMGSACPWQQLIACRLPRRRWLRQIRATPSFPAS